MRLLKNLLEEVDFPPFPDLDTVKRAVDSFFKKHSSNHLKDYWNTSKFISAMKSDPLIIGDMRFKFAGFPYIQPIEGDTTLPLTFRQPRYKGSISAGLEIELHVDYKNNIIFPAKATLSYRSKSLDDFKSKVYVLHEFSVARTEKGLSPSVRKNFIQDQELIDKILSRLHENEDEDEEYKNYHDSAIGEKGIISLLSHIHDKASAKEILMKPILKFTIHWLKKIALTADKKHFQVSDSSALKTWLQGLRKLGFNDPDFNKIIGVLRKLALKHLDDWDDNT
jgi:hypothetical protein